MKKILLTFAAMLSFSATTLAQSITILENQVVVEDGYEYEVGKMALAISPDSKYVCGSTDSYQGFIINWKDNDTKYLEPEEGCELRSVSNTGVAAGYDGSCAITFDVDGTKTVLSDTGMANAITSDGTLVVGNLLENSWYQKACYWKNGELTMLPEPTAEEVGFNVNGAAAYYVSADGSVIVGYVVDDMSSYPAVAWILGEDGTYTVNPICKGYFTADMEDETIPYVEFRPSGVSADGKYVALSVRTTGYCSNMGRYNLETNTLEVADFELNYMLNFTTSGIANDGTMVGYCEDWSEGLMYGFIWKAGEASYAKLSSEYPDFTNLAAYDTAGHIPTFISPDGNYIVGWGYNPETYYCESYVLDRNLATGINTVSDNKEVKEVARYTIDGAKISTPTKGLNIVKMSDGTTKKVIVK
ncbi:MAG: hypothetical protein Q4D41_05105 [Prevotellaceae bacterium]|nr:hypothetical protein [Prevotellaceae bacterium]